MWKFWNRDRLLTHAELARRTHEVWLDRALRSNRPHPGIPTREVRLGGFRAEMRTPSGRAWARGWWERALTPGPGD